VKLSEALDLFLLDRRTRDCGIHAIRAYYQHCKLFLVWLEELGVDDVALLESVHVERFLESLRLRDQMQRDGKLSPVTIHKRMKHLKTFFLWMARKGYVVRDLLYSFPIPKNRKRLPKALSPEQASALLAVPMIERDRAVLFLMLDSGLRISEITALIVDDLDLARGMVRVRHGKGDKERYSRFSQTTGDCVRKWLELRRAPNQFLFVDKLGNHLTVSGVYKIIKRLGEAAQVRVNPHALRHTFATEHLNAGGSVTDLQLLMGHEHIETTMVYAQIALDPLRERFSRLSLITRLTKTEKTG
jgi:integrase/recombinase XerC